MAFSLFARTRAAAPASGPAHAPYGDAVLDELYNLCFCDRPRDFAARPGAASAPWQDALCGERPDLRAAAALAADAQAEARVRALACHVLRAHGRGVPPRTLLGVVAEVPTAAGLDTLAAYADGSVRRLHPTAHAHLLGPLAATRRAVCTLLSAADRVVRRLGPMAGPRRPPPARHDVRLSFLVTDGPCFDQGGQTAMRRDECAGPALAAAGELLHEVLALALRRAA